MLARRNREHEVQATTPWVVTLAFVLCFTASTEIARADTPLIERVADRGTYTEIRSESLTLQVPGRPEPLQVKATYPALDGPFPVIVFSHGNFCEVTRYDKIIHHWVSHGYVVLQPSHLDAAPFDPDFPHSQHTVWVTRLSDVNTLVDAVIFNGDTKNTLNRRIESTKVITAGHSYGALTAQALAGAKTMSRDGTATVIQSIDPRVTAVIAISPPGAMEGFVDETTASAIRAPMLVTTGTRDFSAVMWPDWRAHRLTFDTAPDGNKALLVLDEGDHYLGGLICLERDTPDQTQGLYILNAVTTAFLNSHVFGTPDIDMVAQALGKADSPAGVAVLEMK